MTPQQKDEFEGLIVKAIQAGKAETSGLIHEIIHRMEPTIENSIKIHVNGKIDRLHSKLDNYIADDTEWKKQAEPVIKMGESVQGFGKVSLYMLGFIASATGAIVTITKLINSK